MVERELFYHTKEEAGHSSWAYEREYLPSIRQMCLEIHVHIHIRILDRTNRLDMIQPKALRHLTKVWRGHGIQEPRHDLLDGPRLLLGELVDHGGLGHALNVDVVGGLPGAKVSAGAGLRGV